MRSRKSFTWHIDETFVRIAGRWLYLFRAVDSQGQTVDGTVMTLAGLNFFLMRYYAFYVAKLVDPRTGLKQL